jgi:broad specificity phosphatase PhoE
MGDRVTGGQAGRVRVFVARHGRTPHNREGRFQGAASVGLDAHGRWQAGRLAAHLAARVPGPRHIYSSPLPRAVETAAIVADRLGVPLSLSPDLRELDPGAWADRLSAEISRQQPDAWAAWQATPMAFRLPGGESLADVLARVGAFYERERPTWTGDVLLVSHAATISALLAHMHGWDLATVWAEARALHPNAALSTIEIDPATGAIHASRIASTAHLADEKIP